VFLFNVYYFDVSVPEYQKIKYLDLGNYYKITYAYYSIQLKLKNYRNSIPFYLNRQTDD